MTEMPERMPEIVQQVELAFESERKRSRRFLRWIGVIAGIGLVYMAISVHLKWTATSNSVTPLL